VLYKLCDSVVGAMSDAYPELTEEMTRVRKILRLEEERFDRTLEQGLAILNESIRTIKGSGQGFVPGDELFRLYDTYGFPLDIARDVAAENGLSIDEAGFHKEMEAQKVKARASWSVEGSAAPVYRDLSQRFKSTEFVGYESVESESTVIAIIRNGEFAEEIDEADEGEVLLDRTPFYAESGGQVGDTGEIRSEGMKAEVIDTKKPAEGFFIHKVKVKRGVLKKGAEVHCTVSRERRAATRRNHTATHLLHAALRDLLGEHVKQAGSLVSPERLRFDFSHFYSLDRETLDAVEDAVNGNVLKNIGVETSVMETKRAVESGVTALFGEKYGDIVRVVTIPGVSAELCGGTHTPATGSIGVFKIISEGSVASGIRRIEAATGDGALDFLRKEERELRRISELMKTSENPSERLEKLLSEMKDLEKSLEKYKGKSAAESSAKLLGLARTVDGVKVIAHRIDGIDLKDLRVMADNVRNGLVSGILLLASVKEGQASLVAMVTRDLTGRYSAGELLKKVASAAGGRGGGKPDVAQGGTKEIGKLDEALESLYELVRG
jgi:alanyl-tRNA synthetase